MAYNLNEKLRNMQPYHPLQGNYPVRLDANESFLPMPDYLLHKIQKAVCDVSFNRYPDPFAEELCGRFAELYRVDAAHVTAGNGSDELISVICSAFLQKGEAMLTLQPDFSMYRLYGEIVESNRLEYRKRPDFTIDVDAVIDVIRKSKIKLLIFSNPCNPTSKGLKREEVRRLIRSLDALVVLDEAYMDFWDESLIREANQFDNLIVLKTCSKAMGSAAIRLGFAVANGDLTNALKMVKSPYNVNTLTQKIGSILLNEKELIQSCIGEIRRSRSELDILLRELEQKRPGKLEVIDGVTNFVTVRIPEAPEIRKKLLERGVSVSGFESCLRITAGTTDENRACVTVLESIL